LRLYQRYARGYELADREVIEKVPGIDNRSVPP
jgi:hypothetical protein